MFDLTPSRSVEIRLPRLPAPSTGKTKENKPHGTTPRRP
jgi:hypothetical protein